MESYGAMTAAFLETAAVQGHVSEEDALKRVNPLVSTQDVVWNESLQYFTDQLNSGETIRDIISRTFTSHEAQLLIPSDLPDMRKLQEQDTKRYHTLVSGRFKDVEQSMAAKLAMVYLGLPVEPLFSVMDQVAERINGSGSEAPLFDAPKPLQFLTSHDKRNWGREVLRGFEAPSYPVPIPRQGQPSVGLRGGWAGDPTEDASESDGTDFLAEDQMVVTNSYAELNGLELVPLYGFQGKLFFEMSGDVGSFSIAVLQLLSLNSFDRVPYTLVHFDKKNHVAREIHDKFPVKESSPIVGYIASLIHQGLETSALFVKLSHEKTPVHWEPMRAQMNTDVGLVFFGKGVANPPCAYVPFPKMFKPTAKDLFAWGANQYLPNLKVAFEVLVGRADNDSDDRVFEVDDSTLPGPMAGRQLRGLDCLPNFDLSCLHPRVGLGSLSIDMEPRLKKDELAFFLPSFVSSETDFHRVRARRTTTGALDPDPFPDIVTAIRNIVTKSFRGRGLGMPWSVRLLSGRRTLGPDVIPQQPQTVIHMQGSVAIEPFLPEILKDFLSRGDKMVLLYPIWVNLFSSFPMLPGWAREDSEACPQSGLPALGSDPDHFRSRVRDMARATNYEDSVPPEGEEIISITPKWPSVPEDDPFKLVEEARSLTFYVDANTDVKEWFSIRAQIPTPQVVVNYVDKSRQSWQAKLPKSNVWGPRYGLAAKTRARWNPAVTKPRTGQDGGSRAHGASSTEPVGDGSPSASKPHAEPGTSVEPQSQVRRERPGDLDKRGQAWALQPSIFGSLGSRFGAGPDRRPEIPINAPPKEPVHRTTSSVPMFSKGILTPTEQAALQQKYWETRGIALGRIAKCPYEGCKFTHRQDEKAAIADHLRRKHLAQKCMWCDEPIYEFWSDCERTTHLREKHKERLYQALGTEDLFSERPVLNPFAATIRGRNKESDHDVERRTSSGEANFWWKMQREFYGPGAVSTSPLSPIRSPFIDEATLPEKSWATALPSPSPVDAPQLRSRTLEPNSDNDSAGQGFHGQQEGDDSPLVQPPEANDDDPEGEIGLTSGVDNDKSDPEDDESDPEGDESNPKGDESDPEDDMKSVTRGRRPESPDWSALLGHQGNFKMEGDQFYCSKCLRKVPKLRTPSPRRSPQDPEAEIESHTDMNRCCRIRNAIGDATDLPNRSGWIPGNKMPKIRAAREKFLGQYPAYARTIYPLNPAHRFQSHWDSDPNNQSNQDWWDMPWPPYEGEPPFPDGWDAPPAVGSAGDGTSSGALPSRKSTPRRAKTHGDGPYSYRSDEDSDDGLQPDVDDLNSKKRKKQGDATFRPSGEQESEDDEEKTAPRRKSGRARKRSKKQ